MILPAASLQKTRIRPLTRGGAALLTAACLLPTIGRSAAIVSSGGSSPAGPTYSTFSAPILNNNGRIAFTSFINAGFDNNAILVTQTPTGFQLQQRTASAAPGTEANTVYTNLAQRVAFDDNGKVTFSGNVGGPNDAGSTFGVWSTNPSSTGVLSLIARENKAVPTIPGALYSMQFSSLALHQTNSGLIMLGDTTAGSAIWRQAANSSTLQVVVREAFTATPGIAGGNFGTLDTVAVNATARIAFQSAITATPGSSGIDDSNDRVVYSDAGAGGSLALVAREGSQAADIAAGVRYDFFYDPSLNNNGKLAFAADLRGTGIIDSTGAPGTVNNQAVYRTNPASTALQLVARAGSAAPGTAAGVVFDRGFEQVRIGTQERVSFVGALAQGVAGVTEANDTGIWGSLSGTLALVAREGAQAPGLAAGIRFGGFKPSADNIALVTANHNGQVAFKLTLTGPLSLVDGDNDTSLWAQRPDGVLTLVAREGNMWQVNPGDSREIVDIGFNPGTNSSQFSDGWNDSSQIAFTLEFLDGSSGIFMATVPEPGAASLLAFGAVLLGRRRRRG